jgi:hypothetical protein
MASSGQVWHISTSHPRASFPKNICEAVNYAGENVGVAPTPEWTGIEEINGMMMAEPHKRSTCSKQANHACNIINANYRRVGIGVVVSGGMVWLTEDFLAD